MPSTDLVFHLTDTLHALPVGKTTEEVEDALGLPTKRLISKAGEVWEYRMIDEKNVVYMICYFQFVDGLLTGRGIRENIH